MSSTAVAGSPLTRRSFVGGAVGLSACLAGCSKSAESAPASSGPVSVNMGTMVTEDFLPGWVADRDNLFGPEVDVSITTFQSAQELSLAITSGDIDLAMTDPQVSATLAQGGTPVRLLWIALGATPKEGRFGIQVGPDSNAKELVDLAGARIGVGSNTVPEYVMDRLLAKAGVNEGDFVKEELKKMPVRFEMMSQGKVDAAALPASLLALGEKMGCKTLMDDTHGDNLSQSVIVAREDFAASDEGARAIESVNDAWERACKAIQKNPEEYRDLLVERASLPEPLAKDYPIQTYPQDSRPTQDMIQPQLDWMLAKGYLKSGLTYDEESGTFREA